MNDIFMLVDCRASIFNLPFRRACKIDMMYDTYDEYVSMSYTFNYDLHTNCVKISRKGC